MLYLTATSISLVENEGKVVLNQTVIHMIVKFMANGKYFDSVS